MELLNEVKNWIETRMSMFPDEPNLSERGAYDAYLNVLNIINSILVIEKKESERDIIKNVQPLIHLAYNTMCHPNQKMFVTRRQLMDLLDCFNVIIQQVSQCECAKERKAVYDYFKEIGCIKK